MVLEVVHKWTPQSTGCGNRGGVDCCRKSYIGSTMRAQVKNGLGGAGNTVVPRPNPAKEG